MSTPTRSARGSAAVAIGVAVALGCALPAGAGTLHAIDDPESTASPAPEATATAAPAAPEESGPDLEISTAPVTPEPDPFPKTGPTRTIPELPEFEPTGDVVPAGVTTADRFDSAYNLGRVFYPYVELDNTTARTESGEPRELLGGWYLRRTVWATWRAPFSGVVSWQAAGDGADLGLNVYTGRRLDRLTLVASNDQGQDAVSGPGEAPNATSDEPVILSMPVTKNKRYYLQVGGSVEHASDGNGAAETATDIELGLASAEMFPENEFLYQAEDVTLAPDGTAELTALVGSARMEAWEPRENDEDADRTLRHSVWYAVTLPVAGDVTVESCTFLNVATVGLYRSTWDEAGSGVGWGNLTHIDFDYGDNSGCNGFFLNGGSSVTASLNKGATTFVQIGDTYDEPFGDTADVDIAVDFDSAWIGGISREVGKTRGGYKMTITGQELAEGGTPTVKFGGRSATVVSSSDTEVVVRVPRASREGAVKVRVITAEGSSNRVTFRYRG